MSQSAAPHAARQGSQSVAIAARVMVHAARCSPQNVPSVAKIPKYLLNHAVISQCTVVIATEKTDRPDKLV